MRLLKSCFCLAILAVSLTVSAQDKAPALFGVDHGVKHTDSIFSDFNEVSIDEPGVIALAGRNPPKPHSAFRNYYFKFHPEKGVCWGQAQSEAFDSDRYGSSVRSAMDKVHSQLSARYGDGDKTDRLAYGSIWDDRDDWAMGVQKNERFYFYMWENLDLGNNITQIALLARSRGFDTQMVLEWEYTTDEACDNLVNEQNSEAF